MERSADGKVYLRINLRAGGSRFVESDLNQWFLHPDGSVDVAALNWVPGSEFDIFLFPSEAALRGPLNHGGTLHHNYKIGVGDEVFLTGLFINHVGNDRNIPIIRIGNIAAMPGEPIKTGMGQMEAYLIEARSIGGLSGSPVFVNLGYMRAVPDRRGLGSTIESFDQPKYYLLGLVHGHYDVEAPERDSVFDAGLSDERINMGIAIVVPIDKVFNLFDIESEKAMKKAPKKKPEEMPTMDSAEPGVVTKEEFSDALKKASRKLSPPDQETKGT
jgi:hypothetical protein